MKEYDTIVVGGGPIGGFIAGKLAKEKYNVAVFEKNKEIGTPLSCAGLVTERVFDFVDSSCKDSIQNNIRGANIHSPANNILKIGGNKTHGLVIDRQIFDRCIIKDANKKGAEIFIDNNVLSASKNKNEIEIKTSTGLEAKTPLLIGADGPFSKIRDRFIDYKPKEYLRGIGAEIKNVNCDPNFVEIFVGNNLAPGFFAWIIPTNKKGTTARIGLCTIQNTKKSPKFYFDKFLKNKFTQDFLSDAEIKKYISGIIPLGFLKKTYNSNVMVVGDAAAQIKPTSGGGIFTGLLCAKYCVSTSSDCLKKGIFSEKQIKKYHKNWTKKIGKELSRGMKFRSLFCNLSDEKMDKYIGEFDNSKIIKIINEHGDIDFPSKLVKPLLKNKPSLIKFLPDILRE